MTGPARPKPVRGRRIDGAALSDLNRMAVRRSWPIDWFGVPATARVVRVSGGAVQADHGFAAEIDGLRLHVGMSGATAEAVALAHLGPVIWDGLPPALMLALFQECVDALGALPANAGLPVVRLGAAGGVAAGTGMACTLETEIVRAAPAEVLRLFWMFASADLAAWAVRLPPSRRAVTGEWLNLPFQLLFELGWVDLPLNELQTLRPGDVVVPDAWHGDDAIRIAVNGSPRALTGQRPARGRQITVTGATRMNTDEDTGPEDMPAAAETAQEPDAPDAPPDPLRLVNIADVALRLTFDLGHARLSLRELADIVPGHVFDLGPTDASGGQRVTLRANGVAVGDGELVEIQGRVGIAVTRIAPPAS